MKQEEQKVTIIPAHAGTCSVCVSVNDKGEYKHYKHAIFGWQTYMCGDEVGIQKPIFVDATAKSVDQGLYVSTKGSLGIGSSYFEECIKDMTKPIDYLSVEYVEAYIHMPELGATDHDGLVIEFDVNTFTRKNIGNCKALRDRLIQKLGDLWVGGK